MRKIRTHFFSLAPHSLLLTFHFSLLIEDEKTRLARQGELGLPLELLPESEKEESFWQYWPNPTPV